MRKNFPKHLLLLWKLVKMRAEEMILLIIYGCIVVVWSVVIYLIGKQYLLVKKKKPRAAYALAIFLLGFVCILYEHIQYGVMSAAEYALIPTEIHTFLSHPIFLLFPKVLILFSGILILFKWGDLLK